MRKLQLMTLLMLITAYTVIGQVQKHNKVVKLMGTRFEITAIHEGAQNAWDGINAAIAEITRIEKLISSWKPNSQTSAINKNAVISPVKVDQELFGLIMRSIHISKLTNGAFDISYAAMDRICGGAPQKAMYMSADYFRIQGLLPVSDIQFCNAGKVMFGIEKYRILLEKVCYRYGVVQNHHHDLIKIDGPNKTATTRRP